jgi:endo-1,4-beta-xylanase
MAKQRSTYQKMFPFLAVAILVTALGLFFAMGLSAISARAASPAVLLAPAATVIAEYDFEDNTTQGWFGRGSAAVAVTDTQAVGAYSLLTSNRTQNWEGPGVNVTALLQPGATYAITASVRLAAGSPNSPIQMTMYRNQGGDNWDWIATTNDVTDAAWATVHGTYSALTGPATYLELYLESSNATVSFYIDEVVIVEIVPPPPPSDPNEIARYDFEDNTTQGWFGRGSSAVVVTDTQAVGAYSLLTSNRTQNWEGPGVNVTALLQPGATYAITASVRLAAGSPNSPIQMTMYRNQGGDNWDWIATTNDVTDAAWATVHGTYSALTGPATYLELYLESSNATVSFYIDEVIISELVAPPTPDSVYDFEDGTTQTWFERGDETITATTAMPHSGSYSLLTTGRTATWNGPGLDLLPITDPDATYNIDLYVRLTAGSPASEIHATVARTIDGNTTYQMVAGQTNVTDGGWTHLAGTYTYSGDPSNLVLYVEVTDNTTADFYLDDVTIAAETSEPPLPIQTDIPSLYQTQPFSIGAAIMPDLLDSVRHTELLTRHINIITPENVMKWDFIEPTEGVFTFAEADKIVNFAEAHGMDMHGHTFVWHIQTPDWVFEDAHGNPLTPTVENKALLLGRMENHIRAMGAHYANTVDLWDVVNEVVDESQPDCLRRSPWYEITGSDYITRAFEIAHEVVPTATLIINDYETTNPVKRACLYNLIRDMRANGVPVEGVGHQMHINIQYPSVADIEETLEYFADLGIEQHVTELDMNIYTNDLDDYGNDIPLEVLIEQGYRYRDIFEVFRRHTDQLKTVTLWGLADDRSWLNTSPVTRTNAPLLFDRRLQAKYAYWGVVDPSQLPVLIKTRTAPQRTMTIDGLIEPEWFISPFGEIAGNGQITASFQTTWDEDYLYVLVEVEDPTFDAISDTVELFIDENNAGGVSYDGDDRHYTLSTTAATPAINNAFTPRPGGYFVEAAIPFSAAAVAGQEIGFDIRITDSSAPGSPISWNDPTHSQHTTPDNFGTVVLSDPIRFTNAHETATLPVVDGEEDAAWSSAEEIATETWVMGSSGATARIKTLWDGGQQLFVYAVVSDTLLSKASANPWEEDSLEIFIDQNNGKTISYEADDGQYRINFDNEQSFGGAASAATIGSATRLIPGGYVVEAVITLTAVTPADGTLIGTDFQVNNDQDGNGTRDSVVTWNDPTGETWRNTSRMGILRFVALDEPPVVTYALTVTLAGDGAGVVTSIPAGIDCGVTCTVEFTEGSVVTLTATAETGSTFTGWSGEGCSGSGTCVVTMSQARHVTATFELLPVTYKVYLPIIVKSSNP